MAIRREISAGAAVLYLPAQVAGCVAGAILAHAMFGLPLTQTATHVREGAAQVLSEGVATFALVFVILGAMRHGTLAVAAAVALTIAAGYWWTASTSFANPAITIARAVSDTFAGVRPADVPGFIAGQFAGALVALSVASVLFPRIDAAAEI
jgi:glycerol uptake facilitator-like aquaporin